MGFRPVTFSELTDDKEFWAGCEGCKNFDILVRNDHKLCLCTGLLYDPAKQISEKEKEENTNFIVRLGKGIATPFKAINKKLKNNK